MSSINFDNVLWLLIAIPLVLLFSVPFLIAVRKDNANCHNITSGIIHIVMAILIAFTAAGTNIVTTITETDIYVLADVSYSASRNLETIDGYIAQLNRGLPDNSRLGVICFGKDHQILSRLGETPKSVTQSKVDDSETDIVSALEYAGSLFRDNVIKRIVVITDGKQTYEGDEGALRRTVDSLNAEKIRVDAIYIDDNLSEDAKEVQVSDVSYTNTTYLNGKETVEINIQSSYNTNVTATLFKGEEKISEKVATVTLGSNALALDLDTSEVGTFDYEVRVVAEGGDENTFNNSKFFTQTVSGEMKVLLLTEKEEDERALAQVYGETAEIDAYVGMTNIPCSVEALCAYDQIVLADIDITKIGNYEMFLASLDTVVSLFGKSLMTFGDTGIQNKTEGELKALNDMLPVRFGNNLQDPKLYTIVIDSSLSMLQIDKLTIAKRAATQLIDSLAENDEICVVTFYGSFEVVQRPTRVGDYENRTRIKNAVNNLQGAQGTLLKFGLQEAERLIKDLNYSEKQVMLISDGLSFDNGSGETDTPLDVIDSMHANGIVTSVIDVGRGSDTSPTAVDAENLLKGAATHGAGTYYFANTVELLESVVFKDILSEVTETEVNRYSYIAANRRRDDVLSGIEILTDLNNENQVYIGGYYISASKASAVTVLTADYYKASGASTDVPIYAYWKYGNGRVSSFTTTLTGRWIEPWSEEFYSDFFHNVITTNIPNEKINYPFNIDKVAENGFVRVDISPATVRSDATVNVKVTLPGGEELSGTPVFDALVYSYYFATPDLGKYMVEIMYSYADVDYLTSFVLYNSYLPEYNSFEIFDASVLHKMVGSNGVVSEDGKLEIVNDENEVGTYSIYLTVPLMIVAVVLFAIDIGVRKLKWNDIKSLFVKVQGKKG